MKHKNESTFLSDVLQHSLTTIIWKLSTCHNSRKLKHVNQEKNLVLNREAFFFQRDRQLFGDFLNQIFYGIKRIGVNFAFLFKGKFYCCNLSRGKNNKKGIEPLL